MILKIINRLTIIVIYICVVTESGQRPVLGQFGFDYCTVHGCVFVLFKYFYYQISYEMIYVKFV